MTFEEEFPSLLDKEGDYFSYLYGNYGDCEEDFGDVGLVDIEAVEKFCLDKQRVKEAIAYARDWNKEMGLIENILKELEPTPQAKRAGITEPNKERVRHLMITRNAKAEGFNALLEELGLEDLE